MKQNSEFSQEEHCQEAGNIVFCKILRIFSNSAQFTNFSEKFCYHRIADSWWECLSCGIPRRLEIVTPE